MPNEEDFNLIKRDLVNRVGTMENKVDVLIAKLEVQHEQDLDRQKTSKENIDKLNHIIIGNGTPGIAERLRNIEGVMKHITAIWIAVMAWIGEFAFRTFIHHTK